MVQQIIDSKFSGYGQQNTEKELPTHDKQLQVPSKKMALRDLQNDNSVIAPDTMGNSPLLNPRDPTIKISGNKRPSHDQSPSSNAANGHFVYVRRKSEGELGKSSAFDSTSITAECPNFRQLGQKDETINHKSHIEESRSYFLSAISTFPFGSSMGASGKASDPHLLAKPAINVTSAESNYCFATSAISLVGNPSGLKTLQWEERYYQLHLLLRKLDQSNQEEYLQVLRSLSSVELSRHAVELEKRSIQLSLEEAKELQRVRILNVLGKNLNTPLTHEDIGKSSKRMDTKICHFSVTL